MIKMRPGKEPNETERLMMAMGDAATTFYGKDSAGRTNVDPRQMLEAMGSLAGAIIKMAPSDMRRDAVQEFLESFATHAGFNARIDLAPLQ